MNFKATKFTHKKNCMQAQWKKLITKFIEISGDELVLSLYTLYCYTYYTADAYS